MQTDQLDESAQIQLDVNGNGAVFLGPTNSSQRWTPTTIAVQVTSNVKEPSFKFYRGHTAGSANYKGGTTTGSNDNSDVNGITLYPGDGFYCVWQGGDANAIASVTLTGTLQYD